MRGLLRNLWRQTGRTALTAAGISIGIFALTVMGALAEKFNAMISNGERYFTHQISVYAAHANGAPLGANFFPLEKVEEIKRIPGVDEVAPEVLMLMEEEPGRMSLGMPPLIYGTDLSAVARTRRGYQLVLREGRMPRPGERGWVVLGAELAFARQARVGGTFRLRGRPFRVVGVADRTMTGPDRMAFVALEDAQELLVEGQPYLRLLREQAATVRSIPEFWLALLPPSLRRQLETALSLPLNQPATAASVAWRPGEDPETVARRIRGAVAGVEVYSPAQMRTSLRQATLLFNLLVLGSAAIALAVGTLAVINTMTMAVLERTREIGLKRALGATTGDILREYLLEAGFIGLLGGAAGFGAGYAFTATVNRWAAARGALLFEVTPRLGALGLVLATGLGVAAGLYPALRAARLDCVTALREE